MQRDLLECRVERAERGRRVGAENVVGVCQADDAQCREAGRVVQRTIDNGDACRIHVVAQVLPFAAGDAQTVCGGVEVDPVRGTAVERDLDAARIAHAVKQTVLEPEVDPDQEGVTAGQVGNEVDVAGHLVRPARRWPDHRTCRSAAACRGRDAVV